MLTRSEYFDGRAAASREMRDAATDVSVAYAHGQLANRYQFAATTAHAAEQLEGFEKQAVARRSLDIEQRDMRRRRSPASPRATDTEDERWVGEGGGSAPSNYGPGNDDRAVPLR